MRRMQKTKPNSTEADLHPTKDFGERPQFSYGASTGQSESVPIPFIRIRRATLLRPLEKLVDQLDNQKRRLFRRLCRVPVSPGLDNQFVILLKRSIPIRAEIDRFSIQLDVPILAFWPKERLWKMSHFANPPIFPYSQIGRLANRPKAESSLTFSRKRRIDS